MSQAANRVRIAWTILLSSFVVCLALAVAVPLGARWFLFNAELEQAAILDVTGGTVFLGAEGSGLPPVAIQGRLDPVAEGSSLVTAADSQATLTIADPGSDTPLATFQIYSGASLQLTSLRSPRYSVSPQAHQILLDMTHGRVRVSVSLDVPRPIVLVIRTPHGQVQLDREASASIEVSDTETSIAVHAGDAGVLGTSTQITLTKDQRTILADDQPLVALTAERDLIANGYFQDTDSDVWQPIVSREREDQPAGSITFEIPEGRRAVRFRRHGEGLNWAQIGLRQEIQRDVRDYRSLRLHVLVRILSQDLFNCGVLGTECPVMVKLIYRDENGNEYQWLQGFYAGTNHSATVALSCVTCPGPKVSRHLAVPASVWFPYDSPNLIEFFTQAGAPPATITAIEIYASGHAFESLVAEVELLAQE